MRRAANLAARWEWRPSLGASLALHGALAGAAVLPFLAAPPPPLRASAPAGVAVVWASLAPAVSEERGEEAAAEPEPQPLAAPAPVLAEPEPAPLPDPPALPEAAPDPAPAEPLPAPPPQVAPAPRPQPPPAPRRVAATRTVRTGPGASGGASGGEGAAAGPSAAAPTPAAEVPAGPILVTAPRYRSPPAPPAYPPRAIELGLTGTVLVRVRVGRDGSTEELRVWRSSGHPLLDAAALAAVRRWAFEPAAIAGTRVESWVETPVHFRLN